MKLMTSTSLLAAVLLVSACGGSSSGGPITVEDFNSFSEIVVDVVGREDRDEIRALSLAALEAQGSASFEGYLIANSEGSPDALFGRTLIDADFTDGGSLSGEVTDFVLVADGGFLFHNDVDSFEPFPSDAELTELDGSLTLSNGSISSFGGIGEINVAADGDVSVPTSLLEDGGTGTQEFEVTGSLEAFVTDTGEFIAEGELTAESETFDLDLEAAIFAE